MTVTNPYRIIAILGSAMFFGSTAVGQNWDTQYLALGAAHGPVVVDADKRQFSDAYIRYPDPIDSVGSIGLYVHCVGETMFNSSRNSHYIRIANGKPFLGSKVQLTGTFDIGGNVYIGEFSYAGGGYSTVLDSEILDLLSSNNTVVIANETGNFDFEFSLFQAAETIENIECLQRNLG